MTAGRHRDDALFVGVEAGRTSGTTELRNGITVNSLPAVFYLLQYDRWTLVDQVQNYIYWLY